MVRVHVELFCKLGEKGFFRIHDYLHIFYLISLKKESNWEVGKRPVSEAVPQIVASDSCIWLTEVEPSVFFNCYSSSTSRFDALCMLRWFSSHHVGKESLVPGSILTSLPWHLSTRCFHLHSESLDVLVFHTIMSITSRDCCLCKCLEISGSWNIQTSEQLCYKVTKITFPPVWLELKLLKSVISNCTDEQVYRCSY